MTRAAVEAVPDWPAGVGRIVLDRVDSTNAEALRRMPGLSGPVWIMAREQVAGRGRRGRGWSSQRGNFAASLALPDAGSAMQAAQLGFVAALALRDVLAGLVGPLAPVAIKWPNDILINGDKISGILLESTGSGSRITALAVGIGVNLEVAPPPGAIAPDAVPPICLRAVLGDAPKPEVFLNLLAPAFAHWQGRLTDEGFAPLRSAWLTHAARLGQIITARTPRRTLSGRFEGIDPMGALILVTDTGREIVPAADIHF